VIAPLLGIREADVTKVNALSAVATAQNEAGFKLQSAATFDRATQAAMDLRNATSRVTTLSELGRAQYQAGRIADALRAFDDAFASARENKGARPGDLLTVLSARIEAGLTADAEAMLAEAVEAMRSAIVPFALLPTIASVQEKMGRRDDALATYRQAASAIANKGLMAGPQAVPTIWYLPDALHRSRALVAIANALPD
jgi:tetratricopeptide (TPR) repeat protein